MIQDYSEKRDFIRMNAQTEVSFQFSGEDQVHHGLSLDLSGTGVKFETSVLVKAGSKLIIRIAPENTATPPLDAEVKVIRVEKHEIDDIYLIAAEFIKIKP